jgi:hypothetical protein
MGKYTELLNKEYLEQKEHECPPAGAWGKAVRVGLCVPPCGRLLLRSNIAHNGRVFALCV